MQHLRNRQRVDRWGRREHGGYGRPGSDVGLAIAVDAAGAAYVTGNTESADFTAGCMAPCTVLDSTLAGMVDAFVAKISHIGVPATLTVTPATATTLVNTQHCVSATVVDALGNPTPAITVQFSVTGAVTDHGPATPLTVTSVNVQAVVCSSDHTHASIHGDATVNGSATVQYRIEEKDRGEPGRQDTYRIVLSTGYDSGEHPLEEGNIQIH